MNIKHLFPTVIFIASMSSSFSLTLAEIAPAALPGKTLIFNIANGGSPFATNGTWSGRFSASGTGFTAAKITGDLVNISTSCTFTESSAITDVSLGKFVEGQAPANLLLYIQDGIGRYEVFISGVNGVALTGTFAIGIVAPKGAEIDIQQPAGSSLTDASSSISFGSVKAGTKSISKTFVIKNGGAEKLKGLAISKSGKHASDFILAPLKTKNLAEGGEVKFKVTFKPKKKGTKNAVINIKSSDKDESSFTIKLTGKGTP